MSYLNPLRLHFAGEFQANVSTVNNDPAHFDNAAFRPDYQKMQGPQMNPPNGWFNPQGDAAFRLLGCQVTSAFTPAGAVPAADPVMACLIADSDGAVPAKLVDLDSEQQLVSEVWELTVRIATIAGDTLMRGDFAPAAFMDIWDRATGQAAGDVGAGAMYQSVLVNLRWGDVSASPFLTALKGAAATGRLSIKFNVDGLNMDFTSPKFMCGRIVGSIGPAAAGEPDYLLIGRQFMAAPGPNPQFFNPAGQINFCAGQVDAASGVLFLDLGNALSTSAPGAGLNNLGDLTVSVTPAGGQPTALSVIPAAEYAGDPGWYPRTAGVVALPLTAAQLQLLAAAPLSITGPGSVQISEWASGAFVRADRFVWRLSPGDKADIPVYATQWGRPLAGATIAFTFDPSQLQSQAPTGGGFPFSGDAPAVATPAGALGFGASAVTDASGRATLAVTTSDPGTPRWFNNGLDYGIDGQVYGVRPGFTASSGFTGPDNQWSFVSFLLWSGFTPANPLTWTQIQPILQQYANLYPVMLRFLDMGDYDQAVAHKRLLQLAFGLDPADPNSMPVTRDLSPAKREAVLAWLENPLPGPTPVSTRPPAPAAKAPAAAALAAANRGGKASAAARRLVLRPQSGDAS